MLNYSLQMCALMLSAPGVLQFPETHDTGLRLSVPLSKKDSDSGKLTWRSANGKSIVLFLRRLNRQKKLDYEVRFSPRPELTFANWAEQGVPFETALQFLLKRCTMTYRVEVGEYLLLWCGEPEAPSKLVCAVLNGKVHLEAIDENGLDVVALLMSRAGAPYRVQGKFDESVTVKLRGASVPDTARYLAQAMGAVLSLDSPVYVFTRP